MQPQVTPWLPLSLMVVDFVPTILLHHHTLAMLPGCPPSPSLCKADSAEVAMAPTL